MTSKVDQLSVGVAAAFLRVSVRTLQRWDKDGALIAKRTDKNRRYYTREQLTEFVENHEKEWKPDRTSYYSKS
jgi:predicted site-specific integrase-resolvase